MSKLLEMEFAGVKFDNPIILGSATPGWDGRRLKEAGQAGASGVICKTIGPPQTWAKHPRCGRFALIGNKKRPIGMINLELFTTNSKEMWLNTDLKKAKEGGAKVIASILALPDANDTAELALDIKKTEAADLLELNVSCPMPADTVGMHIGKSPELIYEQVKTIREVTDLPLTVKMTPNVTNLVEQSKAAKDAGANGVTISNSIRAFAGVDIEKEEPILPAYGGYTGPAIKPIIQRLIAEVLTEVDIQVLAVGGVMSWKDVIEYIMLGASGVQTVTAVMWDGNKAYKNLLTGIESFMNKKGYNSINDFKGKALKNITSVEQYAKNPKLSAKIDPEKCIGCKKCLDVCFYASLEYKNDIVECIYDKCDGCGLCVEFCPVDAIKMIEYNEVM